ncbi:1-acyl-sn-glycerol-3-phosphate acyltransferase [Aliidiomarina sp. Khilg15.8]
MDEKTAAGLPCRHNAFLHWLGGAGLKMLGGWTIQGQLPDVPKAIVAIAPHTSNWDFFVGLFVKFRLGLSVSFLGKHSIFRFPIKGFLTRIGGIPVNRRAAQGVVGQMVDTFARREQLILVITPEGTRKRVENWKTGFLRIAKEVHIPVVPVVFDYARRVVEIQPGLMITQEIGDELERVKGCFAHARGKIESNAS